MSKESRNKSDLLVYTNSSMTIHWERKREDNENEKNRRNGMQNMPCMNHVMREQRKQMVRSKMKCTNQEVPTKMESQVGCIVKLHTQINRAYEGDRKSVV